MLANCDFSHNSIAASANEGTCEVAMILSACQQSLLAFPPTLVDATAPLPMLCNESCDGNAQLVVVVVGPCSLYQ